MWKHWVIDASTGWPPALCPIEHNDDGSFQVVVGMNLISREPPGGGKIIGVFHPDGQEATEDFISRHKTEIDEFFGHLPELAT